MKKILAIALAAVMMVAVLAVAANAAAEPALLITAEQIAAEDNQKSAGVASVELKTDDGKYAQITSAGDDPWIQIVPTPKTDVANKYAVVKYRSTSEKSTGVEIYTEIAEPHATTSEAFQNDGQWHTIVIDLSTAAAQWKGNFSRLDPMNAAGLPAGEVIDIAWIALFASEADAKAYTGPAAGSEPAQPVAEKDPDTWLCLAGDKAATTGWWMHPDFATTNYEFTAKFTTPNAFDGFIALFFANPEGAKVQINLLDKAGAVLDSQEFTQAGDGSPTIKFSKTFAAGTYTLQIKSTDTGAHFVVGSAHAGDVAVEVGGNCNTNDSTLDAPVIVLTGAVASGASEPSNPGTADASVIAIAAVACVALAGVVIAKKVR